MVETTSERLMEPGMAHFECESKRPSVRLNTLRNAGKAKVPFTTGILVGIGETAEERVKSLLEIRKLAEEEDGGDCIGEIIVQNFRAKEDTRMKDDREVYFGRARASRRFSAIMLRRKSNHSSAAKFNSW